MVEALNQKERQPMPVAEQVASIYAGTEGYLDRIKAERVPEFLADLIARLHSENKDVLDRINDSGQLSDEDEGTLAKSIEQMVDDFGPDFDAEGNPLEEGESDRIKDEEERRKPSEHVEGDETSEDGGPGKAAEREEAGAAA
jgi:F-type H+-transporting ATPase subunit alpha